MSVKVFNSQIGHISSSFFKHVGVSKSLKWKFSWWPWTGSVFDFKKQEIMKLRMPISRFRCSSFQGYLYICRIFLGSPSAMRWKTHKKTETHDRWIGGRLVGLGLGLPWSRWSLYYKACRLRFSFSVAACFGGALEGRGRLSAPEYDSKQKLMKPSLTPY